ncbi:acyl transferase [Rubrolithibacter danxiaensis]|uniref:LuxE/PaaK family acyltransferase n=1 Tax=Rubrolithibacter danxiaensis TaxID=3390805 RepID=UPI003BF89422
MNAETEQVFSIKSSEEFREAALSVFNYQVSNCPVYKEFVKGLRIDPWSVNEITQIPFLPVEFFKTQDIITENNKPEIVFSSSGTTGMTQSRHLVADVSIYEKSFRKGFKYFYGDIRSYTILALLPSYQEREGSSLIYMVDDLIEKSENQKSGYFLYNHDDLFQTLLTLKTEKKPTILIGVTYALLDFIENFRIDFLELIVMETGGMKGKRTEMIREELHNILCAGFGVNAIHSEYGMTELLSQAYSKGKGIFECPPWMQVLVRDINDPFTFLLEGKTGGINIIDLANINSCSFIATQDLGKCTGKTFEISGRFDNSDIRGCNLLVQ